MIKNSLSRAKTAWNKFFSEEKKGNRNIIFYVLGVFLLGIIIFEGFYLWNIKEQPIQLVEEKPAVSSAKEKNGMIIGVAQEGYSKDAQGTNDSGFELNVYKSPKLVVSKNANVEISKEQFHLGKNSLKISWVKANDRSVILNNYLLTQKDKYYKLGLWVSSAKDGHFKISLNNKEQASAIAEMGVVANPANKFRYYEYNFRSPLEASNLEISAADIESGAIFIDDIKLLPLNISSDKELASIEATVVGSNQQARIGESQLAHNESSDAMSVPKTLIGQTFSSQGGNLAGASFFINKKGNGGDGEYLLELREFNESTKVFSPEKIAVKSFSAKDIDSEVKLIPIMAKLEAGKKYWLGFNNSAAKVSKENYLAIGQTDDNAAYAQGNIFLQKGENKFFTEEKDLNFSNNYIEPIRQGESVFSYGEMLYDLGKGKKRLDYQVDPADGSIALDIYGEKNISIDKAKTISLNDKDSYLAYKIETNGKKVQRLAVNNLFFNNNVHISISTDGNQWTEIFSSNAGKPGQNSGKIEVDFKKEAEDVFIKIKKNGEANSSFTGGYAILDLAD